jgi:hypothetical protein
LRLQFFGFGARPEEASATSPPASPPPVPFVVDEGRVAIVVECLDQKFQRTIRTGEDSTLNEILAQLVKKNPFPVRHARSLARSRSACRALMTCVCHRM